MRQNRCLINCKLSPALLSSGNYFFKSFKVLLSSVMGHFLSHMCWSILRWRLERLLEILQRLLSMQLFFIWYSALHSVATSVSPTSSSSIQGDCQTQPVLPPPALMSWNSWNSLLEIWGSEDSPFSFPISQDHNLLMSSVLKKKICIFFPISKFY